MVAKGWVEARFNESTCQLELVEFTDNGATERAVAGICASLLYASYVPVHELPRWAQDWLMAKRRVR